MATSCSPFAHLQEHLLLQSCSPTLHRLSRDFTMASVDHRECGSSIVPSSPTTPLRFPVNQWSEAIQADFFYRGGSPAEWAVTIVEHCKDKSGKRHEYLCFTLRHSVNDRPVYLFAEHMPARAPAPGISAYLPSPFIEPDYRICITLDKKSRNFYRMATLDSFSPPLTSLELAFLLKAATDFPTPELSHRGRCFWFCAAAWNAIREEFGGVETLFEDRSKFRKVPFAGIGNLGVPGESVRQKYRESRKAFEDRVKLRQKLERERQQNERGQQQGPKVNNPRLSENDRPSPYTALHPYHQYQLQLYFFDMLIRAFHASLSNARMPITLQTGDVQPSPNKE
ncbi:hypothetical protein JAAARDRAFT_79594 [Jaapia argillacea MUCL 33604]|uniref:Uncharacterized protein n=1 Tax=Jaapia argillacea MUCL 33604 TaxID=933084 RepID=A0A067PN10_9AGAM|nr:hypothetical protein JAAARDRAFT_79594 [Jaapia argillacea MUCL 33604]